MMQEVEVLKTIQELICSFFSEEQFTLSPRKIKLKSHTNCDILDIKKGTRGNGCLSGAPLQRWSFPSELISL